MPKLRFDRFMVSEHTNRIFSQDKEQTVSETSRIYFVDNSYGFTHDVSEYDTKLNLQDKTYEISKEQRHQMDLAVLTMRQLETDALRNKDTVLYFTTLDRRYVVINHSDNYNLLTIDEAFASLDNDQTIFILERIHDVSDLFIATVPSGGGLPMAPNTTRIDTIHLRKQNINGQTITQSDKLIMTEEYLNEM